MSKFTAGIAKIEVAPILPDGSTGTAWSELGYTFEDSAKLVQADASETPLYAEEVSAPVKILTKEGDISFEWQLMDADCDTLAAIFGGTSSVTSWEAPDVISAIEQSVKITPTEGMSYTIPRGRTIAKFNGTFNKKGVVLIDMKVTVLQPTKSGLKRLIAADI